MIHGKVNDWKTVSGLAHCELLNEAFEWIQKNASSAELGFHTLEDSKCLVRVMEYALKDRVDANFEHHRETIDLQVTIDGNEGIEWAPLDECKLKGDYAEEKDFQFLETPERKYSFLENRAGFFTILFPQDAHQPQRKTSDCDFVRKLVVKIPTKLVKWA